MVMIVLLPANIHTFRVFRCINITLVMGALIREARSATRIIQVVYIYIAQVIDLLL